MTLILRRVLAVALACPAVACGGGGGGAEQGRSGPPPTSPRQGTLDQAPPARTEAMLVGPLCQGEACRCRQGDDGAGDPPAGSKRFEVRLGPSGNPLWAVVDGMVLHKSRETPDACFYVDLRPGKHAVSLRGSGGEEGLSAAIAIGEQGGVQGATWWYRTFDFQCGTPGQCDMATLESWKREVSALAGKHDPCGSTKVQDIRWETDRMPDRAHPTELILHFTLDVYKFAPANRPGSEACDRRGSAAPGR